MRINQKERPMKHSTIVIYGGGEVGINLAKILLERNAHVAGFLDANKRGRIDEVNLKIYGLDDNVPWVKEDVLVCIALANGNIHTEIAQRLYEMNYKYILFLPISMAMGTKKKTELIAAYNNVLNGIIDNIRVRDFVNYHEEGYDCKRAILREDTLYYWVMVPQEILFSESYDNWKGDKEKLTGIPETYDKNIVLRHWYRTLFDYLEGNSDSYEDYFALFTQEKTEKEKRAIIAERNSLFNIYKQEIGNGMDFFVETAPLAEWNDKGYFNLVGGHHRTVFLLHEGRSRYPVKIQKNDFDKWCNQEAVFRLLENLEGNSIEKFFRIPIPNPAFCNVLFERENQKTTLMDKILSFLDGRVRGDESILDISHMEGYFARILSRMSYNKITCMTDEKEYERIRLLFEVLYIRGVLLKKENECKGKWDLVFAVNETCFKERDLERMASCAGKFFFMELEEKDISTVTRIKQKADYANIYDLGVEMVEGKRYIIYALEK